MYLTMCLISNNQTLAVGNLILMAEIFTFITTEYLWQIKWQYNTYWIRYCAIASSEYHSGNPILTLNLSPRGYVKKLVSGTLLIINGVAVVKQ